ncbi:uncharacterized protein LOC121390575 [Gigantopelta aegis]|uniref:uncharacterized protein LOC121390575 n=1 Tax=Gigantopelta aegis TaxID=1735272 RepID=UPI001B88A1AC|nr:uncharacterized protein LOC121390575 [Gigantopelta aegis]
MERFMENFNGKMPLRRFTARRPRLQMTCYSDIRRRRRELLEFIRKQGSVLTDVSNYTIYNTHRQLGNLPSRATLLPAIEEETPSMIRQEWIADSIMTKNIKDSEMEPAIHSVASSSRPAERLPTIPERRRHVALETEQRRPSRCWWCLFCCCFCCKNCC